mmetsp:Transcript_8330/g.27688  ORF Transcript_8330/g.27688 Transcript_8330/m.27688 type:complete len:213 (-) Transcript_8330:634-1272(-)
MRRGSQSRCTSSSPTLTRSRRSRSASTPRRRSSSKASPPRASPTFSTFGCTGWCASLCGTSWATRRRACRSPNLSGSYAVRRAWRPSRTLAAFAALCRATRRSGPRKTRACAKPCRTAPCATSSRPRWRPSTGRKSPFAAVSRSRWIASLRAPGTCRTTAGSKPTLASAMCASTTSTPSRPTLATSSPSSGTRAGTKAAFRRWVRCRRASGR